MGAVKGDGEAGGAPEASGRDTAGPESDSGPALYRPNKI
jgi:hypothetical protein